MISILILIASFQTQNLAKNPSFDGIGPWQALGPVYAFDGSVAHSGRGSLHYKNSAASLYLLATQDIPTQRDTAYQFSVYIKAKDIAGPDDGGATIALQWHDKDGKFLGGSYPKGLCGTADWTLVSGFSSVCPPNATTARLICYARKGCTGEAWFDDVTVIPVQKTDWSVTLLKPWFRNRLDGEKSLLFAARLPKDGLEQGATVTATLEGQGKLFTKTFTVPVNLWNLQLPVEELPEGKYQFKAVWKSPEGKVRGKFEDTLTAGGPVSKISRFNGHVLVVRGEPFFPLGVYDSMGWKEGETQKRLQEMADAGFNCVIPYGFLTGSVADLKKYLSAADSVGLKVIPSLKDLYPWEKYCPKKFDQWTDRTEILKGVVEAIKSNPAVLAWYMSDEAGPDRVGELQKNYDLITSIDPDHPCFAITNQPVSAYEYVKAADVIGVDPYPVPTNPITLVSDWIAGATLTGKPIWSAVQIHNKGDYQPGSNMRGPTEQEMRAMAFLSVASGSNGLMMYSYYNLKAKPDFMRNWGSVTQLCSDLKHVIPLVLGGKSVELKVADLASRAWEWNNSYYVLVVNPSDKEVKTSFTVPEAYKIGQPVLPAGKQFAAGKVDLTLAPLEVRLYGFVHGTN